MPLRVRQPNLFSDSDIDRIGLTGDIDIYALQFESPNSVRQFV
jgi:hypothetical protein